MPAKTRRRVPAQKHDTGKKRVIVFGSGPIRIGQGIEFDYASVHCVWALKQAGFEVVIVNNNPETVSTDFDTADRLYFEPLTPEDVMNIIETEKPYGVVVAFGGQTAIKLTRLSCREGRAHPRHVRRQHRRGGGPRAVSTRCWNGCSIKRPRGETVKTEEAGARRRASARLSRADAPAYVLGGQNMIIAFSDDDIREYMGIILRQDIENPILIDKYLMGTEIEVDAICDGEDILIPGIMEHIERAGVHSGDSIAVYPAWNLNGPLIERVIDHSRKLALALRRGGLSISSTSSTRTKSTSSRSTRAPRARCRISARSPACRWWTLPRAACWAKSSDDMGFGTGLYKTPPYVAVKVPVFSFEKLADVDILLGPEMKSTGEVLGIGKTREEALYKGLVAAGYKMKRRGGLLVTVRDSDKAEITDAVRKFADLGFTLYATKGTATDAAETRGWRSIEVGKLHEASGTISSPSSRAERSTISSPPRPRAGCPRGTA